MRKNIVFISTIISLLFNTALTGQNAVNDFATEKDSILYEFNDTINTKIENSSSNTTNKYPSLFPEEYMDKCPNDFKLKLIAKLDGKRTRLDAFSFAAINELFWQNRLRIKKIKPRGELPPEIKEAIIWLVKETGTAITKKLKSQLEK